MKKKSYTFVRVNLYTELQNELFETHIQYCSHEQYFIKTTQLWIEINVIVSLHRCWRQCFFKFSNHDNC